MGINIPESVFTKYYDIIDSTITDIFGIDCELIYVKKEEVVDHHAPKNNSINAHRQPGEDKNYRQVEQREDIKLKVYWDSRSWVKVGKMEVPDTSIQTIFFASDLPRVIRADYLVVHKDIRDKREYRFTMYGEPFPMGLRQNRYFGCFWQRAS